MATTTENSVREVTLVSGRFTGTANGRKNNFMAKTNKGELVFIYKRDAEALGIMKDGDAKFPMYAYAKTGVYDILDGDKVDDNGEPIVKVKDGIVRIEATSVFKTLEEFIRVKNAESRIELAAKADLAAAVTESGLTTETINNLVALSL